MRLPSLLLVGLLLLGIACVGDSPIVPNDSGVDAAADSGGNDVACTPSCTNATTFHSCTQTDETCALGCTTTPTPHCAVLQPSSPVVAADLTAPLVGDLVFSKDAVMHTDTGAIDGIRAANTVAGTYEVVSDIGFKLFSGSNVGVFTVKNFTVNDNIVTVAKGVAALAIAAGDKVIIQGILDARGITSAGGLCGSSTPSAIGPGGTAAGVGAGNPGVGAGGGNGADVGGGGGGGFGGLGGDGQHNTSESAPYSVGGVTVPYALPISGGFGGGSMGAGDGGGGGGAVQIVALNEIRIGGGTKIGGVNVGGCGGFGGTNGSPPTGGGGGGSGGEILLQSPLLTMLMNGTLAANGGAGGSGGGVGNAGLLSDQPAQPQPVNGSTTKGPGGPGGAGATLNGTAAGAPVTLFGGGGGGATGRIRIDNATGTFTLGSGAIISPSLGSTATTTTKVVAN